jgi:iron complex outermembrane recepter protein
MPVQPKPASLLGMGMLLFFSLGATAQSNIRVKVIEKNNNPVAFATIKAIPLEDTAHPIRKLTDSSGLCVLKLSLGKRYTLKVSSLNYKPTEKDITANRSEMAFTIVVEPVSKEISEVTVTSKKPLMRQEDDKTIIEPEALAAASTNAYEILEKTPGIFLDQDGNVYLSSTTAAAIYINGREMKMSTADIATMLKNLPPNSISKIEIIRSPSAKYDASGTGGIINIVLRKGVKPGLTGSVTFAAQQGTYGNQLLGFTLNNNDGKKNSYINANISRRNSYEAIITDRFLSADTVLSQNAFTKYQSPVYFLGYGHANALSSKFDLDFSGNISYNDIDNNTWNRNLVSKTNTAATINSNLNTVKNTGHNFYIGNGLEANLKLDTIGSEWESNLWYSYSSNVNNQFYTNQVSQPVVSTSGGDGTNTGRRNYAVFKSDLKLKLKNRFTFESGFRLSYLAFRSVADYYTQSGSVRNIDPVRTNKFRYFENINAFYLQGAKTLGKNFVLKFGARAENTNMRGEQAVPKDTSFTLHRTDVFPYIYLSKKVMAIAGYELRAYLVYRRTLSRPAYEYLNPFPRYIDEYLFEAGNPTLRPQFTHNYEANISVDERPLLAIGVNETKDIFTNVVYPAGNGKLVRTYDNLGKNKELYLRGLGAIPPGKRYFFVLGAQYNHNFYDGLYNLKSFSYKRGTWTLFTYHQLKLDKLSQFTLNGFVRFKGLQQFYELGNFGSLNASLNRQFLKQKLVVTLNVNDMFFTNKNDFSIDQAGISASGTRYSDSRRYGINIRYNFGIRKKEETNVFNIDSPEKVN